MYCQTHGVVRRVLAILSLALCLGSTRARACDCPVQSLADALASSAAVFEGKVTRIASAGEGASASLSVELLVVRAWKGVESETITVSTPTDAAACGFAFTPNESYLVYAALNGDALRVDRCGRTRPAADAEADLPALGLGVTPVEPKNDEQAEASPSEPPARGGCAGCVVGSATREVRDLRAWLASAAVVGLAGLRLRARRTVPTRPAHRTLAKGSASHSLGR